MPNENRKHKKKKHTKKKLNSLKSKHKTREAFKDKKLIDERRLKDDATLTMKSDDSLVVEFGQVGINCQVYVLEDEQVESDTRSRGDHVSEEHFAR